MAILYPLVSIGSLLSLTLWMLFVRYFCLYFLFVCSLFIHLQLSSLAKKKKKKYEEKAQDVQNHTKLENFFLISFLRFLREELIKKTTRP